MASTALKGYICGNIEHATELSYLGCTHRWWPVVRAVLTHCRAMPFFPACLYTCVSSPCSLNRYAREVGCVSVSISWQVGTCILRSEPVFWHRNMAFDGLHAVPESNVCLFGYPAVSNFIQKFLGKMVCNWSWQFSLSELVCSHSIAFRFWSWSVHHAYMISELGSCNFMMMFLSFQQYLFQVSDQTSHMQSTG